MPGFTGKMKFKREKQSDVYVITLMSDSFDTCAIEEFKYELAPLYYSECRVILDLSHVYFVDSSGIGAILTSLRTLNASGGDLKICGINKPVQALFELVRIYKIFDTYKTREEALQAFQGRYKEVKR